MLTLCGTGERYRRATTISALLDDVLLEIFDLYREEDEDENDEPDVWGWNTLVHVCRRWRQIVFASPLRLDLKILCTSGTPVRKNLGIWPALPIVIDYSEITNDDEDNMVTALEHVDRVCKVDLGVTGSGLEKISTAMRQTFPNLAVLFIWWRDAPVLPASLPAEFLGGSAPRLQTIQLGGISFPALPTLLLSTSDLVSLELYNIPPNGYISPEAMVVGLAALPRLNRFTVLFQLATSRPDRMHPPPVTRTVLPALTTFEFQGSSEYLEDLAARIDAPQLDEINIYYLNQLVDFQVAQLSGFIDRSVGPKLALLKYAQVSFHNRGVTFDMSRETGQYPKQVSTTINSQGFDWQVLHMAQVLSQFSTTLSLSAAVNLKLEVETGWAGPTEAMDEVDWRYLILHFPTMKTMYVSQELAEHIALALEHIFAGAFPSLDLIFLEGQSASSVEKFLAARKFSGRPVTVVDTEAEFDERVESYISK